MLDTFVQGQATGVCVLLGVACGIMWMAIESCGRRARRWMETATGYEGGGYGAAGGGGVFYMCLMRVPRDACNVYLDWRNDEQGSRDGRPL